MKQLFSKQLSIAALAVFLPWLALAQSQQPLPTHIWGAASNGICAGVSIEPSDWPSRKFDFAYNIELGNMTTNFLWAWFPQFEQRYKIELRGPDGQQVRQLRPLFHAMKSHWTGLRPLSTNLTSCSLDWCFIKDTFDVRTNGAYTLIASVRVNVFTSFIAGQSKMRNEPTYFLLPPVTNTFNILPGYFPPIAQTNSPAK